MNINVMERENIDNRQINRFKNITKEMNKDKIIEIENMTVSYQGKIALDNINLSIKKGAITGIIGPNGAGKSSLIKGMLDLVDTNKEAKVYINGEKLNNKRKEIAYVEQRNALDLSFPINVEEVVMLGTFPKLGYFKIPRENEREKVEEALKKVKMTKYRKRQIGELSGGQLQRVFIARALAQEADILLLDEPFIGINAVSEGLLIDVLRELKAEGKTIVIVHHDLHKAREYFDEIIILDRVLIANGPIESTFTKENINKAYGESMGNLSLEGVK